ncbi:TPA: translation initiation factor IF-6 [Candidatus Micrarchaeota archaeon]|nr:translation initiation factor IF-6 [Candidatus Micrarchaeota archaeon]HIH30112.1 translation initiation factor IF-6 [Candidatus Micrarchaeota archaeon]
MLDSKTHNYGNPHIGLFSRASDKLVTADISSSPKFLLSLGGLGVPVVKATFGGSGLSGIFLAMNSKGAVVSPNCTKDEVALLKSHGLDVCLAPAQFSAAGNNIAANDFGAVANPKMPQSSLKRISDCLGVEVVPRGIAGYDTVGSCLLATNKGFAAHNRATGEELKELQSILGVPGENCTLNTGIPFVAIGAVANSKAAIFGESSTGFEIGRVSGALCL